MTDQLLDELCHPADDLVAKPSYELVHFIYLATIGFATIGWLWLLAWVALWLGAFTS
jgi:hypothetical protein